MNSVILIGAPVLLCKCICIFMGYRHRSALPSIHLKAGWWQCHCGCCCCPLEGELRRCCAGRSTRHMPHATCHTPHATRHGWLVSPQGSSESCGVLIHHLKSTWTSTHLADGCDEYQRSVPPFLEGGRGTELERASEKSPSLCTHKTKPQVTAGATPHCRSTSGRWRDGPVWKSQWVNGVVRMITAKSMLYFSVGKKCW